MPFLYHPFAVHFPIALFLTSAVFDVTYLVTRDRFYDRAGRFLIGLGLLGALMSIVLGFVDFRALVAADIGPAFVEQHHHHSSFAYAAVAVYLASFLLRWRWSNVGRATVAAALVGGAALIAWAIWLGSGIRKVM